VVGYNRFTPILGEAIRRANIAHADETTHYRGSERRWLWALCTPFALYFMTHYSRGKRAATELLGDLNGMLIIDRHWGGYKSSHESTAIVLDAYHS